MRIILSLILVAFFSIHEIAAQFNFHRTYPVSGRSEIALGITQTNGGYYTYNGIAGALNEIIGLNVSKFDAKGEMTWSRDLELEKNLIFLLDGEILQVENDTIVISALLSPNQNQDNVNVIIKLDPQGNVVWTKGLGGFDDFLQDGAFPLTISAADDNSILIATTHTLQGSNGLSSFSLYPSGEVKWSNRINIQDSLDQEFLPVTFGSTMVEDSSSIVGGYGFNAVELAEGLLVKIDSVGTPIWAKTYVDSLGGFNVGNDIAFLSDSTYILAGRNATITNLVNGFILKVDRDGNLIWSKQINIGGMNIETHLNHVVETASGDLIVSGEAIDIFVGNSTTFKIKLNRQGEQMWGRLYTRTIGAQTTSGELISISEDGTAYWGTAVDATSAFAHFIVSDSLGNAGGSMAPMVEQCAQEIVDTVVVDWPTAQFEYSMTTVADTAIVDNITQSVGRAIGFDIPTITLVDTAFCPNDPIFVIEDAFVEGADSYLWHTEETTSSIEVTEEGNPMVEVTINDERGCFTLCDTATISVLDSTMISIGIESDTWCEDRMFTLTAFPSSGLGPYDIIWSTGDTVPQISFEVNTDETLSFTVEATDQCDISASQSIDIVAPPKEPADYTLAWNIDRYCETGIIELQLYGGIFNNVQWYDANGNLLNLEGPNPVVSDFGTYSFTALDTCNFELMDEITVPFGLPNPQEINIDFDVDRACATGQLQLELNGDVASGLTNVRWLDAAGMLLGTNLSVIVPDYGTYSVLAIDACQNEIGDEITIGLDNLPTTDIVLIADDTISCETGLLKIAIQNPEGLSNIVWSNGQTGQTEIFVDDFESEYTVTADFCQQNYMSNSVSPSISTDNFVRWPNAFYPSFQAEIDTDEYNNKSFGPFIICPTAVDNYELRIYNQYGNLMFETSDPEEFWDGTKDGNLAPGDVYVWYSTYEVSTVTEEINGTATLIR